MTSRSKQSTSTNTTNKTVTTYNTDTRTNIGMSSGDTLALALGMQKISGEHSIKRQELGIGERKTFLGMLGGAYSSMVNSYEDREDRRLKSELLDRAANTSEELFKAEKSLFVKGSNNKVIIVGAITGLMAIYFLRR